MHSCGRRSDGRRHAPLPPAPDDRGFTLLENVLAVVLVGLVLASASVTFVGSTRSAAALQRHQTAVRLAAQALGTAAAVPVTARGDGCVPLLDGRTASAVTQQWAAAPAGLDLAATDPATTPTDCASRPALVPLTGLRSGTAQTVSDPVVVGGQQFTVRTYVGTCSLPVAGGACVAASGIGNVPATTVYRVVAAVSWAAARGCPGGCLYTASTLRDASDDPLFEIRRPTPSVPRLLVAVPGDGVADLTWALPASPGDSPILGYTLTAVPGDGGTAVTATAAAAALGARLTGLVNGVTYTVHVVATNALGAGAEASTTVIPYPAAVMTGARLAWWLDGADLATLATDAAGTTAVTGSGQPVRRWKDKSARGNDATVRAGSTPPSSVVGAGRVVPDWDGTTTCLAADPVLLPNGATPSTVYVVATAADPTPATAPYRQVVTWGTHLGGQARQVYKVAGSAQAAADTAFSDKAVSALDWSRTSAQVVGAQHDPGQVVLWAAGQAAVVRATAALRSTGTGAAGLGCTIWPDGSVNDRWRGPIEEVVVLEGTATTAERRVLEEYLARKWSAPVTPRAPAGVTVTTAAPGSLAVVWDAPSWDGGSPPTGYTATAAPGGATCTSAANGCVLTGLTTGTTYSVTVTATNAMGTGPASAARTGTA
ncbi:fibronectin type III domain-containing protein [Kineosporia sp. R_H_3]|uniref:fibronectin type III domain-containing protein n=1 Tax=Kineosporia sp. R_H_3 TaxID=1961848 RepID=UPI000B4B1B4A|nr:fibronectin type III domain-containing protein [Kineosporia sp. R_H_3]